MNLNVEFVGVDFSAMSENQKKRFYDDFFEGVGDFVGRPMLAGTEDAIRAALRNFSEKYNLTDGNIQFVWQ